MAYLPCYIGPHKHTGRNVNVYMGIAREGEMERRSGRACLPHWLEVERSLTQFEVDPDSGALSDPTSEGLCLACLQPVREGGYQIFATAYPAQNERKDYWARVHEGCDITARLLAAVKPQLR